MVGKNVRLTPNGFLVSVRVLWMALRSSSGVPCESAVRMPRPPASDTAAASLAVASPVQCPSPRLAAKRRTHACRHTSSRLARQRGAKVHSLRLTLDGRDSYAQRAREFRRDGHGAEERVEAASEPGNHIRAPPQAPNCRNSRGSKSFIPLVLLSVAAPRGRCLVFHCADPKRDKLLRVIRTTRRPSHHTPKHNCTAICPVYHRLRTCVCFRGHESTLCSVET